MGPSRFITDSRFSTVTYWLSVGNGEMDLYNSLCICQRSSMHVGVDEPAQSLRRFFLSFLLASTHKQKPSTLRCTQPSCAGRRGPILIVRAITILRKACNQIQAIKLELHATGGLMPRAFSACNLYTRSATGPRLQRDHSGN